MPTFILALALSLATLFPSVHTVDRATESVVMLEITGEPYPGSTRVCTGFVISKNLVVTAAHCLGETVVVDGVQAEVLASTTPLSTDLALLKVSTHKPSIEFSEKMLKALDTVVGIGYADGMGKPIALQRVVAGVNLRVPSGSPELPPPGLAVDGIWVPGMSGGPVVDEHGEVVGIMQRFDVSHAFGYGLTTPDILAFVAQALRAALPNLLPLP